MRGYAGEPVLRRWPELQYKSPPTASAQLLFAVPEQWLGEEPRREADEHGKRMPHPMPTIKQLADLLAGEIRGDPELVIRDAAAIAKAGPHDVTFVADEVNLRKFSTSKAGAVIVGRTHAGALFSTNAATSGIVVDDAHSAFFEVLELFRPQRPRPPIGVSPQAFVSPSARIGEGTNVYPGAWIGNDVVVGADCDIFPGVSIGPGCRIGDSVTLFSNVVLYADVVLGDRVRIHASSVIGADGFGYRMLDGRHHKIPHFGTVRIGNDVEIGACSTVDRAMIGETILGEGTKLDNHVMIGHNCELGRHNMIVSQVAFAGSATSGDYVVCAGQTGIDNQVHLGDRCVIGSRSGVSKDVPAEATYIGVPAQPSVQAWKTAMAQRKIPEMRKTLGRLEREVEQLTARMDAVRRSTPDSSKPAA